MLLPVSLLLLHLQFAFSGTEIERISIKNEDFTYTVKWEPLKYHRDDKVVYTLYGLGLDDSNNETPVSGCVNISTNFCIIQEEFYTLVVPYMFRVVAIAGNETLGSSQTLDYIPFEDENITLSALNIEASRDGSNLTLKVADMKVPWTESLFDYLKEYDAYFEIEYFARSENETYHIEAKIMKKEFTFLTSIPSTKILCIKVRLVLDFSISFTHGKWTEKCLQGTVMDPGTSKTLFIAIAATTAFGLMLSVLLIVSCTKIGSKIYRHVFFVGDVHIPDDTLKVISSTNEHTFQKERAVLEKASPIALQTSVKQKKAMAKGSNEYIGGVDYEAAEEDKRLLSVNVHSQIRSQENLLSHDILLTGGQEKELPPYVTVEEALFQVDELGRKAIGDVLAHDDVDAPIPAIPETFDSPAAVKQIKFAKSTEKKKRLYSEDSAFDEDYFIPPLCAPLRGQQKSVSLDSEIGQAPRRLRSISENSIISLDEGYVRMALYEYSVAKVYNTKSPQTS